MLMTGSYQSDAFKNEVEAYFWIVELTPINNNYEALYSGKIKSERFNSACKLGINKEDVYEMPK